MHETMSNHRILFIFGRAVKGPVSSANQRRCKLVVAYILSHKHSCCSFLDPLCLLWSPSHFGKFTLSCIHLCFAICSSDV